MFGKIIAAQGADKWSIPAGFDVPLRERELNNVIAGLRSGATLMETCKDNILVPPQHIIRLLKSYYSAEQLSPQEFSQCLLSDKEIHEDEAALNKMIKYHKPVRSFAANDKKKGVVQRLIMLNNNFATLKFLVSHTDLKLDDHISSSIFKLSELCMLYRNCINIDHPLFLEQASPQSSPVKDNWPTNMIIHRYPEQFNMTNFRTSSKLTGMCLLFGVDHLANLAIYDLILARTYRFNSIIIVCAELEFEVLEVLLEMLENYFSLLEQKSGRPLTYQPKVYFAGLSELSSDDKPVSYTRDDLTIFFKEKLRIVLKKMLAGNKLRYLDVSNWS